MEYEVAQDKNNPEGWLVEAINFDGEGEVYSALFYGPDAEGRAKQYADFMNSRPGPSSGGKP